MLVLVLLSPLSILAPLFFVVKGRSWLRSDGVLGVMAIYVAVSLPCESLGLAIYFTGKVINTLPLLHVYTVIEFALLLAVFLWLPPHLSKRWYLGFVIVFSTVAIASALFLQSIDDYNTIMRALESIVLVSFALRYFRHVWTRMQEHNLLHSFAFWFCSAVLLYFSGNLIVFVSSNLLLSSFPEVNRVVWSFHAVLNILFNSTLAYSLWIRLRALN